MLETKEQYRFITGTGEKVFGDLTAIGNRLIEIYGEKALENEPPPWIEQDSRGNQKVVDFEFGRWTYWVAKIEERTNYAIRRSLLPLDRMSGADLRGFYEGLGLTTFWLSEKLGIGEKTIISMAKGLFPIPTLVTDQLLEISDWVEDYVNFSLEGLKAGDTLYLETYRGDGRENQYWTTNNPHGLPDRTHRVLCDRIKREAWYDEITVYVSFALD